MRLLHLQHGDVRAGGVHLLLLLPSMPSVLLLHSLHCFFKGASSNQLGCRPSSLCACQCLLSPGLKACTRPHVCEYLRCGAANSAEEGQAHAIERSKPQRTDNHDPKPIPLPKSSSHCNTSCSAKAV